MTMPSRHHCTMEHKVVQDGVTFDDVLLIPERSAVTPDQARTGTRLTRNIPLKIPVVSAPMDTVTESGLAIALAQEGGIGIIHKNLAPADQAREVAKVKRSENGVITDPITLSPDDTVARALQLMDEQNVSGFPVTADGSSHGRVVGILTRRDMKFFSGSGDRIGDVMTRTSLVTAAPETTLEAAEAILNEARVEKLLLVDRDGGLAGLITMRDIDNIRQHPQACRDARGRLRVGPAAGPAHALDELPAGALGRPGGCRSVHDRGAHAGRAAAVLRLLRDRAEDPPGAHRRDPPTARRPVDGADGPQSDRPRRGLSAQLTPSDSRPRSLVHGGLRGDAQKRRDPPGKAPCSESESQRLCRTVRPVDQRGVS